MQQSAARGHAVVMQPGEGPSYWQPVPANGHADPVLFPQSTRFDGLSMGFQTIAARSRIREHSHGDQIELQICFRGNGRVMVDGIAHPLVPGTTCRAGNDHVGATLVDLLIRLQRRHGCKEVVSVDDRCRPP